MAFTKALPGHWEITHDGRVLWLQTQYEMFKFNEILELVRSHSNTFNPYRNSINAIFRGIDEGGCSWFLKKGDSGVFPYSELLKAVEVEWDSILKVNKVELDPDSYGNDLRRERMSKLSLYVSEHLEKLWSDAMKPQVLKVGDTWNIISLLWTKGEINSPNPIDNSHLIDGEDQYSLGVNTMMNFDYQIIPNSLWKTLVSIYGGGPAIERQVHDFGSGPYLDPKPLALTVVTESGFKKILHVQRDMRTSAFKELACQEAQLKAEECEMWDYFQSQRHKILEKCLESTLASNYLIHKQSILLVKKRDGPYSEITNGLKQQLDSMIIKQDELIEKLSKEYDYNQNRLDDLKRFSSLIFSLQEKETQVRKAQLAAEQELEIVKVQLKTKDLVIEQLKSNLHGSETQLNEMKQVIESVHQLAKETMAKEK